MTGTTRAAAAAITLALLAACSDFLSGPGISTNPNVPTTATPDQLFFGAQLNVMARTESSQLGIFPLWTEQIIGFQLQALGATNYSVGVTSVDAEPLWDSTYGPGGLRDLRTVESGAAAERPANLTLRGEARVLEALLMGSAADVFGSVPYDSALIPQPKFDSQPAVYAHVQAVLDSAIADLEGTGAGTGSVDFFYANDFAKWIAAAHTLKARYYMHVARNSDGTYLPSVLDSVLAEATLGIASADGDMQTNHLAVPGPANVNAFWVLVQTGYFAPSALHIALMDSALEDSLLPDFYLPAPQSQRYEGISPGQTVILDSTSTFAVTRTTPTPIVTFAEDQMLIAEVQYRAGSPALARATLDAYRSTLSLPVLPPLAGTSLLEAILREKYIHGFYNLEAWNDYLRTCYPDFTLPPNASLSYMPARLPVALGEQSTNPNVPLQESGNPGNPNDPKNSFAPDGVTPCYAQINRIH